jgi:hypothetical protein
VKDPAAARLLARRSLSAAPRRHSLRGIAEELTVYEIP